MPRASKATKVSEENGVITWNDSATVSEAFGQKFDTPKVIPFTYQTFKDKTVAIANGSWPSDADMTVLNKINNDAKVAARSSAMNAALADEKAAYESSPEYKHKQLVDSLVANGMDEDEAKAMATAIQSKNKK